MSETEKAPAKGAATGAAWTDTERQAPIPGGRNVNACRKIIKKLKDKLNDDIENIKAGRPVTATAEGEATATPTKSAPRKRKGIVAGGGEGAEPSPKKKAASRKEKSEATTKDEETTVKSEEDGDGEV